MTTRRTEQRGVLVVHRKTNFPDALQHQRGDYTRKTEAAQWVLRKQPRKGKRVPPYHRQRKSRRSTFPHLNASASEPSRNLL